MKWDHFMRTGKFKRNFTGLGMAAAMLLSAPASAAIDGKANLICSTTEIIVCTETGRCQQGRARAFDLPQFVGIDFSKKEVSATRDSGDKVVSPFKTLEFSRNQLIMQGIENGHGWSVAINKINGHMTTSVTGEDVSYMLFGACIVR